MALVAEKGAVFVKEAGCLCRTALVYGWISVWCSLLMGLLGTVLLI